MKKIRRLFEFRRPHVQELDCMDLVIKNQLILLLSWQCKHAFRLRLRPGKLKQKGSSGALIATLPSDISIVRIIISNYWRSVEIPVQLKHITLDEKNLALLGESWNVLKTVNLQNVQPILNKSEIIIQRVSPTFKKISIVPRITIHFNHSQLNNYVP